MSLLSIFRASALLFLSIFAFTLNAANLDVKYPAKGPLKVRLDYGLATQSTSPRDSDHRWVYSSYLEFKEPVSSISDGQLRMMAQLAHREMEADMLQYNRQNDKRVPILPSVMTIVAFDNKIILSSSQKGRNGFINEWPDSPVRLALDRCSALWRDRVIANPNTHQNPDSYHTNQAKCGEVNAFHQYYMTNDKPISDLTPKARVTTVKKRANGYAIIPACGTEENGEDSKTFWGCNLLVSDQDVAYIGNEQQARGYGLHKIAGGVERIGQIQMCSRNRIIWDDE
ncbi:hypothetical protein FSPOR_8358 [Fusarium sporotrichioides]|uniref:Uncharacterized protein n=1 Tax=Fusarium sporotrichioides TaxID=5514 RepID=A0A395RV84_FUSSP|nr:hypothetical protein FSPOR_8358 [Fusarium sporotrichioides]